MARRTRTPFQSVKTEGAILPMDLLQRVADQDADLGGLKPQDYGLAKYEKLGEAVSRSWNRLQGLWGGFRDERCRLDALVDARGTTETREGWLLPLFEELGYGRLKTETYQIHGKAYPVSHGYGHLPVHLLSYKIDLDRKAAGVAGAATYAPHSMVQELLNRTDDHLWGILSNGLKLRLLRDNASLTRSAYVEFDLEAMFEGDAYADFSVLWLTAHASRTEGAAPEECRLEKWSEHAHEQGTRALDALRDGVERAIAHLGAGFIGHRENETLREALRSGDLDVQDYYRQLLRLVYRFIFLFAAEDRGALLDPEADSVAKDRYTRYYSTAALRGLAEKRRGSNRHPDRWEQLKLVMRALGQTGEPRLALPALGSFLWSDDSIGTLADSTLSNEAFLEAVRALSIVEHEGVRRSVDYKHLGPEELGGIYESLLELHPRLNLDARTFALNAAAGSERKTTGSYYTPEGLIQALLDTALDPVLGRAERSEEPEAALLALKVCDPAVGSGHFLIAAAHRIAGRLARVRAAKAEGGESTPEQRQHALRDVIARCVYGVDLNPMALELCKVNLWLEALEPGKPLSFLNHHLQVGNALLGATPRALRDGIPDDAFPTKSGLLTGDVNRYSSTYRKRNRDFRKKHQHDLFATETMPWERLGNMPEVIAELDAIPDDSVETVQKKADRYAAAIQSTAYEHAQLLADAWCAAFVWKKAPSDELPYPIHEEVFRKIERNPFATPTWMKAEIKRLQTRYGFFHWQLAFPDVFRVPGPAEASTDEASGWSGGFDCVLGNPPWEKVKIQEREWFAGRAPDIASARTAADRRKLISALEETDPELYEAFIWAKRQVEAESHLINSGGRYPRGATGDTNTYPLFTELSESLIRGKGMAGLVVKTGIISDFHMRHLFSHLVQLNRLVSAFDFSNKHEMFKGVVRNERFTLLTMAGRDAGTDTFHISVLNYSLADLKRSGQVWELSVEELNLINPNTQTCPLFQSLSDARLISAVYRRVSVMISEVPTEECNPWGLLYYRMFDMTNDSSQFRDLEELEGKDMPAPDWVTPYGRYLSVWEGKLYDIYDYRHGTFEGIVRMKRFGRKAEPNHPNNEQKRNPEYQCLPRYWVPAEEVETRFQEKVDFVPSGVLTFRDVCRTHTDLRTVRACIVPPWGAGNKAPLLLFPGCSSVEHAQRSLLLCGNMTSFAFDYVTRQKFSGGSLNKYILIQLPVLSPNAYRQACPWAPSQTLAEWIHPRVLELTYIAWDLQSFAADVGYEGAPFVWDEGRRERLRAELDAAFFHLYFGTPQDWVTEAQALRESFPAPRDAVSYVMDTFPILRRKDEKEHGSYRTKDMILAVYDRLQQALKPGTAYETILDPPPASPEVAHPPREVET